MSNEKAPLLKVEKLTKHYLLPQPWFAPATPPLCAVDEVSFHINPGETLSLVGESGSGKTTVARAIVRLIEPTSGSVMFNGDDLLALNHRDMRLRRRDLQIIFQDPYASLSPRLKIIDIVSEPLANFDPLLSKAERRERASELLAKVGLGPGIVRCYPHELSGGQRQRVAIARALAPQPRLIVCDEPVSALDVLIQAQIVNLLMDLQAELGIAYLFISHNLAVVRHISDRVAVMYRGKIVETSESEALFNSASHPYPRTLIRASFAFRSRTLA